jgi:hypothetical protein
VADGDIGSTTVESIVSDRKRDISRVKDTNNSETDTTTFVVRNISNRF